MTEKDQLKHWQGLKQQAVDGELTMEEGLGERLAAACDELLGTLETKRLNVESLGYLSGYGGLPSALDMKKKFENVAVGADGAVSRLDDMIVIVETMRDTYLAAIGRLREQDQQTSQALGRESP